MGIKEFPNDFHLKLDNISPLSVSIVFKDNSTIVFLPHGIQDSRTVLEFKVSEQHMCSSLPGKQTKDQGK